MAEIKVSQLPEALVTSNNDLLMIVQNNTSKKITVGHTGFIKEGEEIWENTDIESDFNARQFQIDLSGYNYFDVIYTHDKYSTTSFNVQRCYKGTNSLINMNINTTAKLEGAERAIEFTDVSIVIGDCYYFTFTSGNTNVANLRNIPYKIIAYK